MKKIITLLMAFVCAYTTTNAKTWRVNSNVKAKADFTSVVEAIASEKVVDDDELYLEAGHVELESINLTKKLHLIGPGYGNIGTSNNISYASCARLDGINFSESGSGSSIVGCIISSEVNNSGNPSVHHITIERCWLLQNISNSSTFSGYPSDWSIINCYINGYIYLPKNSKLIGCIIKTQESDPVKAESGSTISNNVIIALQQNHSMIRTETINKCCFTNNILFNTYTNGDKAFSVEMGHGITATNNVICQPNTVEGFPNNIYSQYKLEDIFKMTGNEDEMYELKDTSPAKGYGISGTDCGAYGGERPYVKGGYPQFLPVIYDVKVPNNPTDGKLPVQLKIRTQND